MSRDSSPGVTTARELADGLGGLPLELEQAAAHIWATGRALASYLDLCRQRQTARRALRKPRQSRSL